MSATPSSLRVAVVSIGRSGTSLLSRILHEVLGVDFGDEKDHIPRNHNNPDGYFENREFLELNERILAAAGGAVLRPPGIDFASTLPPETIRELVAAAQTKISAYSQGKSYFGWKDPRLSLTFPIWREAEPATIPIIVFRNPESVLRSIADQLSTTPEQLSGLWFEYYRRIFAYTQGTNRLVVSFDALLHDALPVVIHIADHLQITVDTDRWKQSLATIVKPKQIKHGVADPGVLPAYIDAETAALYRYLVRTTESGGQPNQDILRRIFAGDLQTADSPGPGFWGRLASKLRIQAR